MIVEWSISWSIYINLVQAVIVLWVILAQFVLTTSNETGCYIGVCATCKWCVAIMEIWNASRKEQLVENENTA